MVCMFLLFIYGFFPTGDMFMMLPEPLKRELHYNDDLKF